MAVVGNVKLVGAEKLEAKLKALGAKVAGKIGRTAFRAGAKIVLDKAKQLAPVQSGKLKRSLKVRAGKAKRKGQIRFVVQTAQGDFAGDTFYGAFLEFGHKAGSRKGVERRKVGEAKRQAGQRGRVKGIYRVSDQRKEIPPQKYLEPAFKQSKDEALAKIIELLKSGIEAAAKR